MVAIISIDDGRRSQRLQVNPGPTELTGPTNMIAGQSPYNVRSALILHFVIDWSATAERNRPIGDSSATGCNLTATGWRLFYHHFLKIKMFWKE